MSIKDDWINGKGFPDTLVIDGHIHIGAWPHNRTFRDADEAVDQSVKHLDAHGIDAFVSVGGGYQFTGTDHRYGNDFLLEVWQQIPDRLIPFLHVNPNAQKQEIADELERMLDAGVHGIKLINAYQEDYPGDGPNLMTVYEFAAKHGMCILNHAWTEEVIMTISAEFPEVDFIFGHYGSGADAALKACANVHANTWSYWPQGTLDRGVANCGAENFMFGSDGFLNPLSVGIGPVVFAPISDEEKRLILGLNLARLLDKAGGLPTVLKNTYPEIEEAS
ncbi:amidohydrolase family protein [Planctomycetota bacterium]